MSHTLDSALAQLPASDHSTTGYFSRASNQCINIVSMFSNRCGNVSNFLVEADGDIDERAIAPWNPRSVPFEFYGD